MAAVMQTSTQNSTLGWQLRLLGQRLSEGLEALLSGDGEPSQDPAGAVLPEWVETLLTMAAVAIAALLVAWLVYRLIAQLVNRVPAAAGGVLTPMAKAVPERSLSDWLQEAKRLEQAGDWAGACRALYMAALRRLSDRGQIAHQPSRTDQEYLRALAKLAQPRPYQLLIRTHERAAFGGETLTAENLQRCRRAYQETEAK